MTKLQQVNKIVIKRCWINMKIRGRNQETSL
jgi:hypothetical protein